MGDPLDENMRQTNDRADRAERQLVSLIALYPDFWTYVSHIPAENFRLIDARQAWQSLTCSMAAHIPPDPASYLSFHDSVYPVAPLREVALELMRHITNRAYLRQALEHCSNIAVAAYTGDVDRVRGLFLSPPHQQAIDSGFSAAEVAGDLFDELHAENNGNLLSTNIQALDRALGGGIERQTSTVIMGRPGSGKSAALVQMADMLTQAGNVVAVFSLEMSKEQWVRRMAARRAKISIADYRAKRLTPEQVQLIENEYVALMDRKHLIIYPQSRRTTAEVAAICENAKRRYGRLDAVIGDHLRLFSDKADNETHRLGAISWAFKQIAKELDTRVIIAAQLSRAVEGQSDKRPDLKDLRDSGEIEENADNVVALYRERYYTPTADRTAEFISRKARDGERNIAGKAIFMEEFMSFERVA